MRCPPNRPSGAAGAASAAGACARHLAQNRAAPPANMMVQQIRRTGRTFFILIRLTYDDIFVSFHPLVRTRLSIRSLNYF